MATATFSIRRGGREGGEMVDYRTEVSEGMVVLDAVHQIQAESASDLACRWNCKAGKCGSCSAEINGMPKLMCMTRLDTIPLDAARHDRTDAGVSAGQRSYQPTFRGTTRSRNASKNSSRVRPMPKTEHGECSKRTSTASRNFANASNAICVRTSAMSCVITISIRNLSGPDFWFISAALEMHPLDTEDRLEELKDMHGIGYCNITKCCTKVCPENITITDNAIIPLKERVVDEFYDPLKKLVKLFRKK